jgi:hypothetical protein
MMGYEEIKILCDVSEEIRGWGGDLFEEWIGSSKLH